MLQRQILRGAAAALIVGGFHAARDGGESIANQRG